MIARGGRAFVVVSALAAAASLPLSLYLASGFAAFTVFLALVFRDPPRNIGAGIVAPADGTVREVDLEQGLVSIYLALRNVHVTRSPLDGVVERTVHLYGPHRPAFSKSTGSNERMEITMTSSIGEVKMVQMTGAIARRIVPYVKEGQNLVKGDKVSLIRFGSRVDIRLPTPKVKILVSKGQSLRAGVTQIAEVIDGGA